MPGSWPRSKRSKATGNCRKKTRAGARVFLLAGLIGTALAASCVSLLLSRAVYVEGLVVSRTAELESANQSLAGEIEERIEAQDRLAEHANRLSIANRELQMAKADLRRMANNDLLTGLLNRRLHGYSFAGSLSASLSTSLSRALAAALSGRLSRSLSQK